jgi:imidazolonepropionase-like amidohydrolase
MSHRIAVALCLALSSPACTSVERIDAPDLLVLSGATLIDGTGAASRPNSEVVLSSDRILRVGARGAFSYPNGTRVIDVVGRWMVPGFMDLHAHVPRDLAEQAQVMRTLLAFGITGFRNPSETTEITGTHLRDRLSRHDLIGPRMWTAGRLIDAPGSVWEFAEVVTSEDEIRAVVRQQADQRVDYIKLYTGLAPELVTAAIDEAHRRGLKVIGHLGRTGWAAAARAGIDAVTHTGLNRPIWELLPVERQQGFSGLYSPNPKEPPEAVWVEGLKMFDIDAPATATLVSTLAEQEVEVNPNLVLNWAVVYGSDPNALSALEPQYALARLRELWQGKPHPWSPPKQFEGLFRANYAFDEQLVVKLHNAGVLLTAGTDTGVTVPWMVPGVSFHVDLQRLQAAGIPAADVLRIGTSNGARALGVADRLGTVQQGKLADLVVLSADPLADIANTRRIVFVIKGGEMHTPESLLKH